MSGILFIKPKERRKINTKPSPVVPDLSGMVKQAAGMIRDKLIAAKALMVMGRHLEAMTHIENILKEHPDSVECMITAGLIASRMRQVAMAQEWFNRASRHVTGRAKTLLVPILEKKDHDLSDITDLIAEAEAHPDDKERALAIACALGRSGHFRAVERFIPILDF